MQHLPIHPTLVHPHTGQPLQAVGIVNGRTIWPIMGASEDDGGGGDDGGDGGGNDGGDNSGDDGDKGGDDSRLAQARQEAIDRRKELKPWKELAREFGITPDQAREILAANKKKPAPKGDGDKGDDQQVDADAIRRDAEREANEKANARIVRSEVKAIAAATFADPADAPLYVDLSEFEVGDDGEVDAEEIKKALADVIKAKPHLAKKGKGPKPDLSQGERGNKKADPSPGLGRLRSAYAESSNK